MCCEHDRAPLDRLQSSNRTPHNQQTQQNLRTLPSNNDGWAKCVRTNGASSSLSLMVASGPLAPWSRMLDFGQFDFGQFFSPRSTVEKWSCQKHPQRPKQTAGSTQIQMRERGGARERGVGPSTPPELLSSRRAKARTTAQPNMDNHRSRHACSTRFLRIRGLLLTFALASKRTKTNVSSDHLPPVSRARTTNLLELAEVEIGRNRN